ncbi:NifU N-terminal domain-containing protein [Hoeflea sp. Naph1]|jgi:metal-sulfur cluster biosynthetic enzyme|uniref:NifU N-terminal domain-containing protein n=1 Tax=Hoeflea sp. Naph1 TaxID=3388653 RepID=UPI00398FFCC4
MFIQTEPMPDASRLKFFPGKEVYPSGTIEFANREEAAVSPLAQRLFDIPEVAAITFGFDYLIITKNGGDWQHLKPAMLGTIMEHFMSDVPVMRPVRKEPGGNAGETSELVAEILTSLRQVIDPELGYNIVDLGLIYDVAPGADGVTFVAMTTTTPGCPATNYLKQGVHERAGAVEGVTGVEVDLTYEPPWTPEMMSPEAKLHFGIDQ